MSLRIFCSAARREAKLKSLHSKLKPGWNLIDIQMQQHKEPLRIHNKEKPSSKINAGEHYSQGHLRPLLRGSANLDSYILRMPSANGQDYCSIDSVMDLNKSASYLTKFLNSLNPSGLSSSHGRCSHPFSSKHRQPKGLQWCKDYC